MKYSAALIAILGTWLSAGTAVATVNGRCSGTHNTAYCICLDRTKCLNYGGLIVPDGPGNYACPFDADNIIGCDMIIKCPGHDTHTACAWRNQCNNVLPDAVCPGGSDFVCCGDW